MAHQETQKVYYLVEDNGGKRWAEWLWLYQVESYIDLGYTVKEMG